MGDKGWEGGVGWEGDKGWDGGRAPLKWRRVPWWGPLRGWVPYKGRGIRLPYGGGGEGVELIRGEGRCPFKGSPLRGGRPVNCTNLLLAYIAHTLSTVVHDYRNGNIIRITSWHGEGAPSIAHMFCQRYTNIVDDRTRLSEWQYNTDNTRTQLHPD